MTSILALSSSSPLPKTIINRKYRLDEIWVDEIAVMIKNNRTEMTRRESVGGEENRKRNR